MLNDKAVRKSGDHTGLSLGSVRKAIRMERCTSEYKGYRHHRLLSPGKTITVGEMRTSMTAFSP